jgi:nucleoside-diphosphate-sugar epimerase
MKRIILTAARGFIGRHCLPLLLQHGYEVHAVTSKKVSAPNDGVIWHQVDLLRLEDCAALVRTVRASHLLHLAWYVEHGKFWNAAENTAWLKAGIELLSEFAAQGGRRVVATGTCAEYDWSHGICHERNTPTQPQSFYGSCKHSLQVYLNGLARLSGMSSAWARIFLLFGPHEDSRRLVPGLTRAALRGDPPVCQAPQLQRDLLFVEDVASALIAILESDISGPVNLGSGTGVSLGQVASLIAKIVGHPEPGENARPLFPQPSGEPLVLLPDTGRLFQEVGWRPGYTLESGLARTVDWWRSHDSRPDEKHQ